jgi:hypothetical protein
MLPVKTHLDREQEIEADRERERDGVRLEAEKPTALWRGRDQGNRRGEGGRKGE